MKKLVELKNTTSKLEKQAILATLSELEKQVFYYAYNPYYTYYLNFSLIDWDYLGEPNKEMFTLLNQLKDRKITGNEARAAVEAFSFENGDLIKLICNKHLDCGVSAKIFNSIFYNYIPEFSVQLAKDFHKIKPNFPYITQIKYDGVRVICVFNKGKLSIFSRNGKLIYLPSFSDKNFGFSINGVLDGEITIKDGLQKDRPALAGKINSSIKGTIIDDSDFVINVFDFLTLDEFSSKFCRNYYTIRYNLAANFIKNLKDDRFIIAPYWVVANNKELQELYENIINKGHEGLMLKKELHYYSFKRSEAWLKLKPELEADLKCVDIVEGEGKYKNMIGALVCEGITEGKFVRVKVGSGLSDLDRQLPFEEYLNETIVVKYTHIIQNEVGDYSLFAPRFVLIRYDK